MKSNIPWSVKGIDPEAREAAKVAARRAGMTLGEWLNSLILQSGELPEGYAQQIGALVDEEEDTEDDGGIADEGDVDELQARLENLNRKLDQSDRQQLTVSGIDESIERLASTIESSRRLLASGENAQRAIGDLSHRIDRIHARLEEVAQQHRSGIEPKTLMALERAIAGVATHIEKSDRRNTELVQSVEDALSTLGTRVDGAESIANDAVGRIDLALDRLGSRIDANESEQRRNAARQNERLAQIDERLAHAGVERETTLGTVERRLASFEAKLQTVQTRMETAAAAAIRPNIPPDVMTRMEFEDWSRRQASDLGTDTSSIKRSVSALESRLGGIMDRMDRLRQDTEAQLREADRKAEEALQRGASQAESTDSQAASAISDVRERVDEIAQRFDRSNHTTTETMSALEGVLRSLTRRLDALEGRSARAPQPTAPADEEVNHSPASISDLPKRPTWSWGTARHVSEPSAPEVDATVEEPEEEAIITASRQGEPRHERSGPKGDIVEVISARAAPSSDMDRDDDEDGFVEATFSPEEQAANAAGVDYEESEAAAESSERADKADGFGDEEREERPEREGGVDLSNLVFNLKGAREPAPEADDWGSHEDAWRGRSERAEPTLDTEPAEEEISGSGTWLDQARRAAKAAGPGERVSDFRLDDEERNPTRAALIVLVVLVLLIGVAAAGWFFVRPWLAKSNILDRDQATTSGAQTPGSSRSAPIADGPGATAPNSPSTSRSAAELGESGLPSESDIGQPLPGDEGESLSESGGDEGASSPGEVTAPDSPVDEPISADEAMKSAADNGDARAQYALALAYKTGRGVAASPVQALTLMRQAADKNLAVAQRTLGIWYEQGEGVAEDIAQARSWYQKAAENGDVQGMHNLGYFYAEGKGGLAKDGAAAERWFKEAAEKGLVASQVNLAIIYSQSASYEMPVRMDQAYFWSAVAAKNGDVEAERMRVALASALSADTKSQMDQAVQNWRAKPVDIAANGGFDSSPQAFLPADQQPELTRSELTAMQERLNALGFDAGPADGRPGSQTESAIRAFQAAYDLPQTGTASRDLLAALNAIPH